VDSNGLVTWVSAGTCTVSATADGCTATCLVICEEETEATKGGQSSTPGEDNASSSDGNAESDAAPDAADGTETAGDAADGMADMTDSTGTEDATGMTEDMTGLTDSADTADIDTEALYESALEEAASSLADGTSDTSDTSDGSGTAAAAEEEGIGTYSVGEQTILSITPPRTP
ncbi:MAG: hypothetical protein LUE61_02895, partial [Clostridiales bacterium]|nr:hypothetical protein [Clostridiales bacterium]